MQIIDEICARFDRYKSQTGEVERTRRGDVNYLLKRVNAEDRAPQYFLAIEMQEARKSAVPLIP